MRACQTEIILRWAALVMLLNNMEPLPNLQILVFVLKLRRRCRLKPLRMGGLCHLGSKSSISLSSGGRAAASAVLACT
jgi:hypothetical protein